MISQSGQNEISELPTLSRDRYENIFNVYEALKGSDRYYFYNILKKISLDIENIDPEVFKYIKVSKRLPWTAISYQEYKTQHLWWLILVANNKINPIELPALGDVLRIIRKEYISDILNQINTR